MMNDSISRQKAINTVWNMFLVCDEGGKEEYRDLMVEALKVLPAAQPEIIRCKECKHSEHWYRDKRRCFLWVEDGIDVFDDGFCNYAERRTDVKADKGASR